MMLQSLCLSSKALDPQGKVLSLEVDELYNGLSYRIATAAGILAQSDVLHQDW